MYAACNGGLIEIVKYLLFNNAIVCEDCKEIAKRKGIDLNHTVCESIQLSKTLFQKPTTTRLGKTTFPFDIYLFESFETQSYHSELLYYISPRN